MVNGPSLDHINSIKQSVRDGLSGSGGSFLKSAENWGSRTSLWKFRDHKSVPFYPCRCVITYELRSHVGIVKCIVWGWTQERKQDTKDCSDPQGNSLDPKTTHCSSATQKNCNLWGQKDLLEDSLPIPCLWVFCHQFKYSTLNMTPIVLFISPAIKPPSKSSFVLHLLCISIIPQHLDSKG